MNIQENIPLTPFTTFNIGGPAKYFVRVKNEQELIEALNYAQNNGLYIYILGEGSNTLISDRGFEGLVIKLELKGITHETKEDRVLITVRAGEDWDKLVEFSVKQGWWGIENMSGIPGTAGAALIQNINAYGQHAGDVIDEVKVFDRQTQEEAVLNKEQCNFRYRQSIFNSEAKGRYVVLSVVFSLHKNSEPNIDYLDVIKYFEVLNIAVPSQSQIRKAIIEIRGRKFPDLSKDGTAGSFFKNILLKPDEYQAMLAKIKDKFGDDVARQLDEIRLKFSVEDEYKIPTGFIADKILGLKGLRVGGAKLSEKQVITVISEGKTAKADDVMNLFKLVRQKIYDVTGVAVVNEPELVGFTQEELDSYLTLPEG